MKLTLGELLMAVQELPAEEKAVLAHYLQQTENGQPARFTREQALAELEALQEADAFAKADSLLGKYASGNATLTSEELQATLREIATEWENELDEFFGDV